MNLEETQRPDRIFNPRGVAVFGSFSTKGSFAQMMLLSQIHFGFKGRLFPISKKGGEIAGLKIYQTLDEVKEPVDLASISVPARFVPQVLRACLKNGVAGAQIQSSGFAETGEKEGIALEKEIDEIAREGIRVIGPNCFGIHCPKGSLALLPGAFLSKEAGPVAMISQSGGIALNFGYKAQLAGLGISKLISYGNGCDLDANAWLEYLADDPETRYVAAYLEGVKDGQSFMNILRKLVAKKPVVIWKGGLTPLGGRATKSHTGSLGGEAPIWEGVLAQAGVVPVQGIDEMMDALTALTYLKKRGKRLALVGGGGAVGVFTSDLAFKFGLDISPFSLETQSWLQKQFPTPGNSVANPLDTGTPVLPLPILAPMLERILTREPIDIMMMSAQFHAVGRNPSAFIEKGGRKLPPSTEYMENLFEILSQLRKNTGKEIVMIFENWAEDIDLESFSQKMRFRFQNGGMPVFSTSERALRAIRNALLAINV